MIIISANEEHGNKAEEEINQNILENKAGGSVVWHGVDMGRLKDVDTLAKRLANDLPRLDILICNAGIGQAPYGLTSDAIERHFEV